MSYTNTFSNNTPTEEKRYNPITNGLKFNNQDSPVDKTSIKFDFWNNMLKISIAPMKSNGRSSMGGEDYATFDWDNAGVVFLTHVKARILLDEINRMTNDTKVHNVGVSSGSNKLFTVSDGEELGSTTYCFIIRETDAAGNITNSWVYQVRDTENYYSSIVNYDEKTKKFGSYAYPSIEVETFKNILAQYINAATSAVAGSVMTAMKFDLDIMRTNLRGISKALGVETGRGGYTRSNASANPFNARNASSSSNSASSVDDEYYSSMFSDED